MTGKSLKDAAARAGMTEDELRALLIRTGFSDDGYTIKPAPSQAASQATSYTALAGSPPSILEKPAYFESNTAIQIDRYAMNPGRDFYTQLLPGARFAYRAPEMFAAGPLPIITGSGVDPMVLRWVPWSLRHSAALAGSRSDVLSIIEAAADGSPDVVSLQSAEGQERLQDYLTKVRAWASAPVDDQPTGNASIEAQITQLYGSPQPL